MPPDPGEPHEPQDVNPAAWADYLEAVDEYVRALLTPQETAIRREAIMGQIKIEQFLQEKGDSR